MHDTAGSQVVKFSLCSLQMHTWTSALVCWYQTMYWIRN